MTDFKPTPEQERALTSPMPLLVLAGAGTGKTTVLTRRIAQTILSGKAQPEQVLALTFTDKASTEMAERLTEVLGEAGRKEAARQMSVGTFHSFGGTIIRENLLRLGFDRPPSVLSTAASWQLLTSIFDELELDAIDIPTGQVGSVFRNLLHLFSQCKDHLISADDLERYARGLDIGRLAPPVVDHLSARLAEYRDAALAFRRYEEAKQTNAQIDFGDHLLLPVKLLEEDAVLRDGYRRRYQYVFVDEYQDTNHAQRRLLLSLLDPARPNIMVIGDDDQSIYRWRGAVIHNILRFPEEKVFAQSHVDEIPMTLNRRSFPPILDLAHCAISTVQERKPKKLGYHPHNGAQRAAIGHYAAATDRAEGRWIAEKINALVEEAHTLTGKKKGFGAFAILCRKRFLFEPICRALDEAGIPYELVGGAGFYGRWEIRDILSYLRVLADPSDDLALARILLSARWRLSSRDIYHLGHWVDSKNGHRGRESEERQEEARLHLFDAVLRCEDVDGLSHTARGRLASLNDEMRGYSEDVARLPLMDLVSRVIETAGYRRELGARPGFDARVATLNLAKLEEVAREFASGEDGGSLSDFVQFVTYAVDAGEEEDEVRPVEEETDTVKVMTVHQAKGLEFPIVFIPGLADKVFPSRPRDESDKWWEVPWDLRGDREHLPKVDFAGLRSDKDLKAALDARKKEEKALRLDEERRLFYVALTRAQYQLYVSRACWYGTTKTQRDGSEFWSLVAESEHSSDLGQESLPDENPNLALGSSGGLAAETPSSEREESLASLLAANGDPTPWIDKTARENGFGRWTVLRAEVDEHLMRLRTESPVLDQPALVVVSCTGLLAYWACPRRYRCTFVDGLPVRPSPSAALGVEVHRWIDELSRPTMGIPFESKPDEPSPDLDPEPDGEIEWAVEASLENGETWRTSHVGVDEMLARFRASAYGATPATYVEMPFELQLRGGVLRGRIDRADVLSDGRWRVVDFKTGALGEHAIPWYERQLGLYTLAISRGRHVPAEHVEAHLFSLRDGSDIEMRFSEEQLTRISREVEGAMAAIARREFPLAEDVEACRFCGYDHLCPARSG